MRTGQPASCLTGALAIGEPPEDLARQRVRSLVRRDDRLSPGIDIAVERPVRADVEALLRASHAMLARLYPPESRHGLDVGAYERPEVHPVRGARGRRGSGLRRLSAARRCSAEVKSMFVAPDARGRGVGRAILEAIEAAVRGRASALRLETGVKQLPAIRLYEAAGFLRRGPFGSYRDDPLSVFMEKVL
jgi:putative acetyltransferase